MKKYIEHQMKVILLQNSSQLLAGSTYGANDQLIDTTVPNGWSRDLDNLDELEQLLDPLK